MAAIEPVDPVEALRAELAAAHAEIERLSALVYVDDLTGALNRRGFMRELERRVAHCARYGGGFALLLADLDGMKHINDTFGHPAGDQAIISAARTLVAHVRASDSVGRLGGDEFALLLWGAGEEQARHKAADLDARVRGASDLPADPRARPALSMGVAAWREGDTVDLLYARADGDLYFAKARRGRLTR
jgi:diguanylate cyclase (GGDEF)-like protein